MPKQNKIKIALIGVFLMAVCGMLIMSRDPSPPDITAQNSDTVNYNPPTEEEKQVGDVKESTPISPTPVESKPSDNKQVISVIITDVSQYGDIIEVRAFIPNHIRNGTCTITFKKDALKVEKSTPAIADASSSICTTLNVPVAEFKAAGDWTVQVRYDSTDASGVSDKKIIVIN